MARLGWDEGGSAWVWRRRLLAWEEDNVRECSTLLSNIVLQENVNDKWKWLLDPIHGYSVKGTYHFITTFDDVVDMNLVDNVWHKNIPLKVSVFAWCLLRNKIPTKDNLARRRVLLPNDTTCVVGCDIQETTNCLFLGCGLSNLVWLLLRNWLCISSAVPRVLRGHFVQFSNMAGMPRFSLSFLQVVWFACL